MFNLFASTYVSSSWLSAIVRQSRIRDENSQDSIHLGKSDTLIIPYSGYDECIQEVVFLH